METITTTELRSAYSVSELTQEIKRRLEAGWSSVWVRGEISNWRPSASGHTYFSLKDEQSVISCAFFGANRRKSTSTLKEGVAVLLKGRLSVYGPRGSYQIVVEEIEPLGVGALQIAFEELKQRLEREGLFARERKKSIPPYPRKIGIITSPTGAALQDILKILQRRAPHVAVTVIPAIVQGAQAGGELALAVSRAQTIPGLDALVLARGGGSFEDLFCFSDERLARAVAASRLPTVSAVGHEIDFSICDFVADLRAPTPSAAAEILSNGWADAATRLLEFRRTFDRQIRRHTQVLGLRLQEWTARLVSPRDRIREQMQRLDDLEVQLNRVSKMHVERLRFRVEQTARSLAALNPLGVLQRGYVLARDAQGRVVRSAADLATDQPLNLLFRDGARDVVVR